MQLSICFTQINSDLLRVKSAKFYSSFAKVPSPNQGFLYCIVYYNGIDSDAPSASMSMSTDWWWNVLVFGPTERTTMIAFSPFRLKSFAYLRQKHDNNWSEWYELSDTREQIAKISTSIRNIDKQLDNGRVAFEWDDGAGLRVTIDGTYVGMVTLR